MIANPFSADPTRAIIWEMLVTRDSEAFASRNWEMVASDFDSERFEGIDARGSFNPSIWSLAFPALDAYRDAWLQGAAEFSARPLVKTSPRALIHAMSSLAKIEIAGERALAWKQFRADEPLRDGSRYTYCCQTLYRMHRLGGRWRIVGFVGYLPLQDETRA